MYTGTIMGKEAIIKLLKENKGRYFSRKELAELTEVNEASISTAMKKIMKEKDFYKIKVIPTKNEFGYNIYKYCSL